MAPRTSIRTDDQWLSDLRSDPPKADAVTDLRDYLKRGLAKALASRSDVSDADLEDFAQDGVLRVLDKMESFRGDSKFTTWAMAVTIRVAYTVMRRRRWGDRSLEDMGLSPDGPAPETRHDGDPARSHARHDVLATLRDAIDRELTPRQRAAVLAELHGMPVAVLAEQLETSPNALYKLHHDARKRLRAALERAGITAADMTNGHGGGTE
jgi:RNA polymerase sigma-70 factor (ECF subfamily)